MVNDLGASARNVAGKRAALEYAFQNFPYPERQAVGLGDALDLRLAIARPQNRGQLAVTVNAGVVHLDHDNAFELWPDLFQSVRQRMNVAQMQRPDFVALL